MTYQGSIVQYGDRDDPFLSENDRIAPRWTVAYSVNPAELLVQEPSA